MSGTRDPAEMSVSVDDDFAGKNRPFRIRDTEGGGRGGPPDRNVPPNFTPRGFSIGQQVDDLTANYAVVRMILWAEPDIASRYKDYRLAVGIVHPLRPAAFDMSKSTARDIIVYA